MSLADKHCTLFDSVSKADLEGVRRALNLGADVNGEDPHADCTVLHIAAEKGNADIIALLLEWNAKIDTRYKSTGDTALTIATHHGNADCMKLLLDRGASINVASYRGDTLAHLAAKTLKNADAVWDVLVDPAYGLPANELPGHPDSNILVTLVVSAFIDAETIDPQALAALARHGARWGLHETEECSALHTLIQQITKPHGAQRGKSFTTLIGNVIRHTLNAGVSPFVENEQGISAYESTLPSPELREVFREVCAEHGKAVSAFNPDLHKLIDQEGKPTDLALYCACEEKLGALLAPARWSNRRELIKVKQALKEKLPERFQERYGPDLDPTSAMREGTSNHHMLGLLKRRGERGCDV